LFIQTGAEESAVAKLHLSAEVRMKTYKNACLIPRGREELARLVLEGGQSIAGRKSLSRLRQGRKWTERLILNASGFAAVFEFPFPYSPHVDKKCQNKLWHRAKPRRHSLSTYITALPSWYEYS
jgi:hypothetical protein